MRIVVDTNVLVSGVFWGGTPSQVLNKWVQGEFDLVTSEPVLSEYTRVLKELGEIKDAQLAQHWEQFIFRHALIVQPQHHFKYSRDKDDNKFLDCAVAGGAKYLVSGDTDLLVLGKVAEVEIIRVKDFLKNFD